MQASDFLQHKDMLKRMRVKENVSLNHDKILVRSHSDSKIT